MTTADRPPPLWGDVAGMRREFDRRFAAPEPPPAGESDDFVAVGVGGLALALRVTELAWIEGRRNVAAVPAGHPWLLGLVSGRGRLVPVFRLDMILGLSAPPAPPPWIAVCDGEGLFGLALDALEGYHRVPKTDLLGGDMGPARPHARQVVRVAGAVRPVVSLASVRAAVHDRAAGRGTTGES